MKKLFLFAAIAVFASCSNDDDIQSHPINEPQPVSMKNKLKSHIMKSSSTTFYDIKYEYEDLGYVSKMTYTTPRSEDVYTYTYVGDKIKSIKQTYSDQVIITNFLYDDNVIVQETIADGHDDFLIEYKYNSNNEVVRKIKHHVSNVAPEYNYVVTVTDYSYKNGNVESEIYKEYDINRVQQFGMEKYYQYDKNNHPTTLSFPESYRKIRFEGKNNEITPYLVDFPLEINYNSDKLPLKINDGIRVQDFEYYE